MRLMILVSLLLLGGCASTKDVEEDGCKALFDLPRYGLNQLVLERFSRNVVNGLTAKLGTSFVTKDGAIEMLIPLEMDYPSLDQKMEASWLKPFYESGKFVISANCNTSSQIGLLYVDLLDRKDKWRVVIRSADGEIQMVMDEPKSE